MHIVGIVAEYNPFHLGHAQQLRYCREVLHADYIIVVMSGDYVQRGAPALFSKYTRAEMALRSGVDLILELPVASATASAEGFAMGAVSILHGLGCVDQICFGSEAGSILPFMRTAALLSEEPEEYQTLLKQGLKEGLSFPLARSRALSTLLPLEEYDYETFLSSPNNILGIEYCKALLRLHSPIQPVTLLREGMGYHEIDSSGKLPSASSIRNAFRCRAATSDYLSTVIPEEIISLTQAELSKHRFVLEEDMDLLLHQKLLSLIRPSDSGQSASLTEYMDVTEELANRIQKTLNSYQGFLSYAECLKTRELTFSHITRALLHLYLEIKKQDDTALFARVLGFRKASSPLLKEIHQHASIPFLTNARDGKDLLAQEIYVSGLYESILSFKSHTPFCHELSRKLLILD